jgi:tRNA threonylcarbamoyladenosine biosynthesis protein TsaB
MILLLDTSTADCHLTLYDEDILLLEDTWHADRELAEKLLGYIQEKITQVGKILEDISGIGIMKGPGSFTGLRISASVCNTLAADRNIPIVGVTAGDEWQSIALERLLSGEDDQIVLPDYGRPARITQPRK